MKYVECGQQRTAIAMALLFAGGVLGVSIIVGIVIDDLLKDGRLA